MFINTKFKAIFLGLISISNLQAYSEDTRSNSADNTIKSSHSTFHYELTKTLAFAAGYTEADASRIALANNAVDTFPSELNLQSCEEVITKNIVNGSDAISILGTVRNREDDPILQAESKLFHWARRPATNTYGENYVATEIDSDTCAYFGAECVYEVNDLEMWAIGSDASVYDNMLSPIPCVAEAGGKYTTIEAGSLEAFGVFLHALGDSYSHQECMKDTSERSHEEAVNLSCDAKEWHIEQEYGLGSRTEIGAGLTFTQNGAFAIYQALQTYSTNNDTVTVLNSPLPEEINLAGFISDFTNENDSDFRSCIADYYFQEIKKGNKFYVTNQERTPCKY